MNPGHTYVISGRQFNCLTQANSNGDDAQMATNYPLVRLTNTADNKVHYLPTSNFSTMGIATGSAVVTADVYVPTKMPSGQYDMAVRVEAPDDETVSGLVLKTGSLGKIRSVTMRGVTEEPFANIVKKANG